MDQLDQGERSFKKVPFSRLRQQTWPYTSQQIKGLYYSGKYCIQLMKLMVGYYYFGCLFVGIILVISSTSLATYLIDICAHKKVLTVAGKKTAFSHTYTDSIILAIVKIKDS